GEGAPHRLHFSLQLNERERERKRRAIECHASQLLLSRRRFLSYAQSQEDFFDAEFDLVCTESRARERAGKVRHACFVLFGGGRAAGKQTAADVENRAGDVPGGLRS